MATVEVDAVLFGVLMAILAVETIAIVGGLIYVYGQNVYQTDSKAQDSKVSDKHTAQSVEARRAHRTGSSDRKTKKERDSPKPLLIPAGDRAQSRKAAGAGDRRGSILNRIFSGDMTSTPRDPHQQLWEVQATDIELVEVIGVGSCGKVWLANWLGSPCAVKKFDPKQISNTDEFLRLFMKEVELMSKLHHPNIVMFLGACTQPPNLYLMLELCVHGSLFDFLREKKHRIKITMDISVKLALDIARGVKYLHERCNIIQRDLKSANILIDGNLNAKVADFGLSRLIRKADSESDLTACGTPAWTAPEILRGDSYTTKVDVYSYGITLWEILTHEEPFTREEDLKGLQIAYAAAEKGIRPKVPTFCPDDYADLMTRCWDADPKKRPDFGEILDVLFKMKKGNKRRMSTLQTKGIAFKDSIEDYKAIPRKRVSSEDFDDNKRPSVISESSSESGSSSRKSAGNGNEAAAAAAAAAEEKK